MRGDRNLAKHDGLRGRRQRRGRDYINPFLMRKISVVQTSEDLRKGGQTGDQMGKSPEETKKYIDKRRDLFNIRPGVGERPNGQEFLEKKGKGEFNTGGSPHPTKREG